MDVKQANGWLKVKGEADLTFTVAGVGKIDLKRGGGSNPAYVDSRATRLDEHVIDAGPSGFGIIFRPYWRLNYMLGAFNDTEGGIHSPSGAYFDGKLSTRVKQDFGGYQVNFPPNPEDVAGSRNIDREDNQISITEDHNRIYNIGGSGGRIELSSDFHFGLDVKMLQTSDRYKHTLPLVDVSLPAMVERKGVELEAHCTKLRALLDESRLQHFCRQQILWISSGCRESVCGLRNLVSWSTG